MECKIDASQSIYLIMNLELDILADRFKITHVNQHPQEKQVMRMQVKENSKELNSCAIATFSRITREV